MNDEYLILVDENNQEIDTKPRSQVDYSSDIIRSAVLWVTNSKDEVLLAQRSLLKDKDPGLWGPAVAGTVEKGETYDSNIAKEAYEEIGLHDVEFTKSTNHFFQGSKRQFIQWYTLNIDKDISEFTKQDSEVEQIAWVPIQQFLDDYRANPQKYVPAFKEALKFLIK